MVADEASVDLLTGRVAATLGLDRIAAWVGRPSAAAYLSPLAGWVLDILVLSSVSYVLTGREQFESLGVAVIPVAVVIGVWLAKWLRRRFVAAVTDLPGAEVDADWLLGVVTGRVRVAVWLGLVVAWYVQLALAPAEVAAFVDLHGPAVAAAKYVFAGPLYLTLFADLATLLAAGMVVLPWLAYREDLSLDFSDVTGFAGLSGVSRLLSAGSVTYFVGLTAWTAFLLRPTMVGSASISDADVVLFAVLWALGFVLYVAPLTLLHRHIRREKARAIRTIDDEIRALDPKGAGRGIPYQEPSADDIPRLQQKYLELQQVRSAREYPANVAIVEDVALAAFVPLALQWGVRNAGRFL